MRNALVDISLLFFKSSLANSEKNSVVNDFVFSLRSRRGASDGVIVSINGGPNLGFPTRRILNYKKIYSKIFGNDFAREPGWLQSTLTVSTHF